MNTRTLLTATLGLAVAFGAISQAFADVPAAAPAQVQAGPESRPAPVVRTVGKAAEVKAVKGGHDRRADRRAERRHDRHEKRLAMKAGHRGDRFAQAKLGHRQARAAHPVG